MSRLSNRYGSLYDPDRNRGVNSVFNQAPTGVGGQAASFAAAQESERAKQAEQLRAAQAAAQAQQQAVAQEAEAARQRQQDARQTAQTEQEFKLRQAQFENERAIETAKLAESKRAAAATEAYRANQQNGNRLSSKDAQLQRALGGSNMAQAAQNHNARLQGNLSPFPNQLTPGAYSMENTLVARGGGLQQQQALSNLNQNRVGLGYQPVTQQHLKQWGNGASYNLSAGRSRGGSAPQTAFSSGGTGGAFGRR